MPPFAGQGMCAGVRDAANLAWKLDLVLRGVVSDALLDTYQTERLPNAQQVIDFSMELGKVICVTDPGEAAARDAAMASAVDPAPTDAPPLPGLDAGVVHSSAPHAGDLFAQGTVNGRWFDDVHGAGWRFVTVDRDPAAIDATTREWFESIGGKLVPLPEPDAVYRRWFTEHDATWALQRPDFHLFGTATDAAEAAALLADLSRQLAMNDTFEGAPT
jgi:flavoprotein hydroxylase